MGEVKLFRIARKVKEIPNDGYICSRKGDCYVCLYKRYGYKVRGDIYVKLIADDDDDRRTTSSYKRAVEFVVSAEFVIPEFGDWCSSIRKERLIPVDNDKERRRFILNKL